MDIISNLALWATVVAGIATLFESIQQTATPEAIRKTAVWLREIRPNTNVATWREQLLDIFDSLFDTSFFSKKFITRSIIATFIGITFSILLWAAIIVSTRQDINGLEVEIIIISISLAFLYNVIPDYLSLIESRLVLKEMHEHKSKKSMAFFISYDFFLTTSIYSLFSWIAAMTSFIINEVYENEIIEFFSALSLTSEPSRAFQQVVILTIFIGLLSTYLTSIWVWLHGFSGVVIKSLSVAGKPFCFFRDNVLDVDSKPFRSMGVIINLIATLLFMLTHAF